MPEPTTSLPDPASLRSPTVDAVMLEERAASFTRRSIKTASKRTALRLALSMVDLTTLEGKDSPGKVRALCRKAIRPGPTDLDPPLPSVAAVCVYPSLVPIAAAALAGSGVAVASVASAFPAGQSPLAVRLDDVRRAVEAGADEIDVVIARGAFLAGRYAEVMEEIAAFRDAARPAHLKIILETGELETHDNVRRASDLAIAAATAAGPVTDGEVFIKTSTGKVAPAATMPVVLVMLQAIADHSRRTGVRIGMKPAGGIRSARQAIHHLVMLRETLGSAWLTPRLYRFGASSLADDLVRQLRRQEFGPYAAPYDTTIA